MLLDFNRFTRLYFALVLLHVVVLYNEPNSGLVFITRPLMAFSLFVFFIQNGFKKLPYPKMLFAAALLFIFISDAFVLNPSFLLLSLMALGLGLLCFGFSFYRSLENKKGFVQQKPWAALPIIVFGGVSIYYLQPILNSNASVLLIVFILALAILTLAINLKGKITKESFNYSAIGAAGLLLSMTLLIVINTHYSSTNILLTQTALQGLALYFMTWGMLPKEKNSEKL